MYRIPEKTIQEAKQFWTALDVVFISMQITYPITYFPSNWNILTFLYHFSIWFISFYIILCKRSPFMRIYAFKRKQILRKRCVYNHGNLYLSRFTYAYMQLLFMCRISLEIKLSILNSQMLAFWGTLLILAINILKAKCQTFHSNILMRES